MRQSIPDRDKLLVAQRANYRCEYCRIHSDDLFLSFQIDHIIPLKHGGTNTINNLAYACPHCNQHKGSDFATLLNDFTDIVLLYNPRTDLWTTHFEVVDGKIVAKTRTGQASIKIFQFNQPDLVILRRLLGLAGRYP
ncbi:HNH endonuclease [Nibrella viscosa]|uniref:HNH endonuclease n=1 Tax=Nibrella viscosa TaxID=1084524 RepID=UPI0031E8616E